MDSRKDTLRSPVTAPFNKILNEAIQLDVTKPYELDSTVSPSLSLALLKGDQSTPALLAGLSAVKDDNNLIALVTSSIERGTLTIKYTNYPNTNTGTPKRRIAYTVPVGKKAIIKSLNFTGFGTFTNQRWELFDGANYFSLGTTASAGVLFLTIPLTLPAGWIIYCTADCTIDGNLDVNALYQEFLV